MPSASTILNSSIQVLEMGGMELSLKKPSTGRQDMWLPSPSRHHLSEHGALSCCSSFGPPSHSTGVPSILSVHEGTPYRSLPAWVMGVRAAGPAFPIPSHYTETV